MAKVEITRIKELATCELAEAPHWDQDTQSLLYVDAFQSKIHRYFPKTGRHQVITIEPSATGTSVTFIIPVEKQPDLFLISVGRDIGLIRWSTSDPDTHTTKLCSLVAVDLDKPRNNLNDGKCDADGRLWAGTKGDETEPGVIEPEQGNLFVFSHDMKQKLRADKINLSNGLTWSADRRTFYYIDTIAASVDAFDFDVAKDVISNRRKIVDYTALGLTENYPDGMTIDTNGNLWVANYNGAKILCISPSEGRIIRKVPLPIQNPTCVAWGGPDYSTLYVTTSQSQMTEEQLTENPDHGALFQITGLGAKGSPPSKAILSQDLIAKML